MRVLPLILTASLLLCGCAANDVKEASGAIGGAIFKSALYHTTEQDNRDQESCRVRNGGDRNEACEREHRQSFLGESTEQKNAKARAARAEAREQAEYFREGFAQVRGTPNCIDDGVGCAEKLEQEVSLVKPGPVKKRVVSRDPQDFTAQLKGLLGQ